VVTWNAARRTAAASAAASRGVDVRGTSASPRVPTRPGADHLRIGEAAQIVGTSASRLRQWERQGLLRPARGRGGQRLYGPDDLRLAREVARLRAAQLNPPAIRRILQGQDGTGDGGVVGATSADTTGARFRELRLRRGMTLREAAARSGLSSSFISSFERGLSGASLAVLQRLTAACGTTVAQLTRGASASAGRVVRAHERHVVDLGGPGIRMEDLSNAPTALEGQLFVLAPGASSDGWYAHPGEELMFVLCGRVAVWLGEEEYYELDEGDALTFPSTLAHRFRALATSETRLIWVNTPPTF
jgi:DNA-binding transcriptional MerR regulator/quercetin dioxygenase-like cupin family protein